MRRIPFFPRLFVFSVLFASFFILSALLSLSPAVCFAQASEEVTLAWDANSEDNLAGYKLYYNLDTSGAPYDGTGITEGDSPVIIYLDELDDSTDPMFTLTGLEEGQLYYFALTAFDTDDLESDYSDEVSYETSASNLFTITASASGQGSISPEGSVSVAEGSSQTFSFVADSNYHLADVVVDDVSMGEVSAYSFENVSASHTIEAVFEADTFTVTSSAGSGGTISPAGETTASYGESVSYVITSADGYHISDVRVDGESVGQVVAYTFGGISDSHSIVATFAADTFTLTSTAGTGGTISPSGTTSATYGDSVSYTISASTGYHVSDVTVDGESVGQVSSYTFDAISDSHSIVATFAVDTFTITAEAETGGTISPDGDTTVASGENMTLTISPDDNYRILDVTVDGVSVGQVTSYTFESVDAAHTVVASFEIDTFTVTATAGENGTITPGGVESVAYGESLTYSIVPDENYHVLDVQVDGVSVGQVASYTFSAIGASHSIVASFEVDTYTVTAVSGENGTITPSGVESSAYGSSLTYTIAADENYHVSDVMVDSTSVGSVTSYTFDTITASHTIEAVFEIDTFTIVASVSGSGSITPEGTIELDYGASQVFAIASGDGQTLEDVTVDGESVGAVEEYLFENIDGNHTIEAVFVEGEPVFAMEIGSIVMTGDAQQVSFENTFTNPVVVASTLTTENAESVVVRICNVTATGFEISAESWAETDDAGVQDTIGYVVMEAGSFTLPDGTVAEAEIIVSEDTSSFSGFEFLGTFSQIPATGATITSNNDPAAVKAVFQNITTTGFEYQLQEQVAGEDGRLSEMVSYIALEDHETPLGDEMVAAGLREEMLTFAHEVLTLSQPSANGVDTGSTDEETEDDTGTVDDGTDTTDDGTGGTEEDSGTTEDDSTGSETDDGTADDGTTDDGGESGDDSTGSETDPVTGETGNQAPGAPEPVSSETPETGIGPVGLAVADQFADPDAGDFHAKTEWQVIQMESGVCVLNTVSSTALTECSVPEIMLTASTTYIWRARFYDNNGAASEWSETADFETGSSTTDLDEDGVPDDQEADASVDVNHDGISDVDQEEIQSIILPSSHQPIGLSVEDETSEAEILSIEAISAENLPVPEVTRRRVKRLPHGLINFKLAVAEPGDAVTVTVYFDRPVHHRARWMKLDLINDVWIDYSGYVQFSDDRMSVSIELVDGGFGDDDGVANGIIVDPAGIEVAVADDETTTTADESVDDKMTVANSANGCFITGVTGETATGLWMTGMLLILGVAVVRVVRRRNE